MKKILDFLLCVTIFAALALPVCANGSTTLLSDLENVEQESAEAPSTGESHVHSFEILKSDTATCGAAGTATYACRCGEETQQSSPATGNHIYGSFEYVDTSDHKKTCSVCGNESFSSHSWDSGRTVTEANCLQEGQQVFSCIDCSGTYMRNIPKTGHQYDPASSDDTYHVCGVCKSLQSHAWDAGEVTRKPTCQESGTFEYYCSICQMTLVEPLAKLTPHTYDSACDPDCNICGTKRTTEHTFTTAWSKNYKGHWHECTKCGEQNDFSSHNPGPDATEDEEQVCLTCKYVITPKKNHVHKYEAQWSNDEVGHWHECTGCKNEKDYSSHVYDNDCDETCNVCEYERKNAHSYTDAWQMSSFEHWKTCSICSEESKREKHVPGPEASDQAAQTCKVCSFELEAKQEHTHDFGTEWFQTDDSHWQMCSCGEQSVPASHIWTAGEEHRSGSVTYVCTECGMEKKVESTAAGVSGVVIIFILVALVCAGAIAALVIIMKRREQESSWDEQEETADNVRNTENNDV